MQARKTQRCQCKKRKSSKVIFKFSKVFVCFLLENIFIWRCVFENPLRLRVERIQDSPWASDCLGTECVQKGSLHAASVWVCVCVCVFVCAVQWRHLWKPQRAVCIEWEDTAEAFAVSELFFLHEPKPPLLSGAHSALPDAQNGTNWSMHVHACRGSAALKRHQTTCMLQTSLLHTEHIVSTISHVNYQCRITNVFRLKWTQSLVRVHSRFSNIKTHLLPWTDWLTGLRCREFNTLL